MNQSDWPRFLAGDETVFDNLIVRYSPHLLAVIRNYARDDDDASDLLQESWLRIYTQRQQCRAPASLVGWMLVVCRNVCLAAGRSARARQLREAAYARADTTVCDPVSAAVAHELIATLPDRQREAVTLRLIDGCSTKETAAALGCAEGTVKALLHQGVAALRRSMEQLYD